MWRLSRVLRVIMTVCSSVKTEYRLICSGCRPTQGGQGYTGSVSQTVGGRQCQRWSSNSPHTPYSGYTDSSFPDGSRAAAENYCRNPDPNYQDGVWCYTVDPDKRWELCDVPMCPATTASGIHTNFAAAMTHSVMRMETDFLRQTRLTIILSARALRMQKRSLCE